MTDIVAVSSTPFLTRRLRGAARLAIALAAAAALPWSTANAAPILMRPEPGAAYEQGSYYLIPQPYEAVKKGLEQDLASSGLSGFQWRDDTAALSDMEFYWMRISASHHPDLQEALSRQASHAAAPILDQALRAGAITKSEHAVFGEAIARQTEQADETIKGTPYFSQTTARSSFLRKHGKSRVTQEDYGTVMDVSLMTGRAPMTLVWFGGTSISESRHFRLFSCMVGVTCFPNPHIERKAQASSRSDPALERAAAGLAQRLQALSPSEADRVMQGYFDAYGAGKRAAQPAVVRSASLPETSLPGAELPADESQLRRYDNHEWRLLALPDGSLLASGDALHRYVPQGNTVERRNTASDFAAALGIKIAPDGRVWGRNVENNGAVTVTTWRPGQSKARSYPLPPDLRNLLTDDWTPRADGGAAFRMGKHIFTLSPQGHWSQRVWDESLRRRASDVLEQALPWVYSGHIHFGDGLFWSADRDGYGIDPDTASAAGSIKTATEKLFFGSLAGNWALASVDTEDGSRFRIVDLATGQARFDADTPAVHYTSSLARTAHGRLLAVSGSDNAVTVIDMAENKPVLNLRLPKNDSVSAMAFSWKGDKLWIYARRTGAVDGATLFAWNVPDALIDGAKGADIPDQLRCGYSMNCQ